MKAIVGGVTEITQDAFNCLPMGNPGTMHKLANLANSKSKVRTCEGEILKATNDAAITSRI